MSIAALALLGVVTVVIVVGLLLPSRWRCSRTNLAFRYMTFVLLESCLGKKLEEGLANLKRVAESSVPQRLT